MTPMARTLKLLRAEGLIVDTVERWNPFSRTKRDLFGFADLVGLDVAGGSLWAVQCTSADNMSARVKKIQGACRAAAIAWLQCGGKILVVAWSKRGPRGGRKRWVPSRREITLADLACVPQQIECGIAITPRREEEVSPAIAQLWREVRQLACARFGV
jgi:hypothetical protein